MLQNRMDALLGVSGATAFFDRELEAVMSRSYDVKYPNLHAASGEIVPISTEDGPGAESITYMQFDMTGVAKIISDYADNLPAVNVAGKESTAKVRSIGNSYVYSVQEIRAAMMAGRGLSDRMAMAARRANDQKVDDIFFTGDEEHGLIGLLNHPNIPRLSILNDGSGSGTSFASKIATPDKILRDMNEMIDDVFTTTNGVERPDTLLLPLAQYALINTTPRADNSDTTILQFFLKNQPGVTVKPCYKLAGAGTGGADVMAAYTNSPEHLSLRIPQPFEQFPPQETNLSYKVPCHSRCGGLIVFYPLAMLIGEGI